MSAELLLLSADCSPKRSSPALPRADLPHALMPDPPRKPTGRALRLRLSTWGLSLFVHGVVLGVLALSAIDSAGPSRRDPLRIAQVACCEPDPTPALMPEPPDVDLEPMDVVLTPPPWPAPPEPSAIEDVEPFPDDPADLEPVAEPFYEVPLRVIRARVRRAPPVPVSLPAPPVPVSLPAPPLPPQPFRRPVVVRAPAPPLPAPVPQRPARLRLAYAPRVADYYPPAARRDGQQGTVVVVMLVDEAGRVLQATLERSSGYPLLDAAALQLVRNYRFAPPGTRRRARLPVAFSLQ